MVQATDDQSKAATGVASGLWPVFAAVAFAVAAISVLGGVGYWSRVRASAHPRLMTGLVRIPRSGFQFGQGVGCSVSFTVQGHCAGPASGLREVSVEVSSGALVFLPALAHAADAKKYLVKYALTARYGRLKMVSLCSQGTLVSEVVVWSVENRTLQRVATVAVLVQALALYLAVVAGICDRAMLALGVSAQEDEVLKPPL